MHELRVSFPRPCDEKWDEMTPAGRARLCARCDKVVHDLSRYELSEAETLLRQNPGACVRARIGADGTVALKPGRRGGAGRMAMVLAATAGVLGAGAPALARERPEGAIVGNVQTFGNRVRIVATGPGGQTYRGRVGSSGRFRIRGVPAGTYALTFIPACGDRWTVANVVVANGETVVPDVANTGGCIIVGMLQIEGDSGRP